MFSSKKEKYSSSSSKTSERRDDRRDEGRDDRRDDRRDERQVERRDDRRVERRDDRRVERRDDRRVERRDDRRDGGDLVKRMSSLSVTKSSAPQASRVAPGSYDTRRFNDDRYSGSSSGRSDYQEIYSASRAGDDRYHREHQSTSSDRAHRSSDRGYATSASSAGYTEVPRGSIATAPAGGSERVMRSRTKEDTKKVSADRVEKGRTRKGRGGAKVKKPKSKSPSPPPKGANYGPLSVEIYAPRLDEGNVPHWSLFVENGSNGRGIIRDVVGPPLGFQFRAVDNVVPEHSDRHIRSIRVADIDDVEYFDQTVRDTAIQNDVQGWSCQDWVLEALEDLNVNQILDDYDYAEARAALELRYDHGASSSPSDR
jgi:hypothetical protein